MIAFDLIRKQLDDFLITLQGAVSEYENLQNEANVSSQSAHADVEKAVGIKKDLDAQQKRLDEERLFLQTVRNDQKAKELRLEALKVEEMKDTERKAFLESKKQELLKEVDSLEKKRKELSFVEGKLDEIKEKQSLLDREKTLDRERKILLDAKEANLKREEERLKRIAGI